MEGILGHWVIIISIALLLGGSAYELAEIFKAKA